MFAGTRDTANPDLQSLAKEHPDKVHIVKLVSADVEGNQAVAKEIHDKYGRVDVVIANAGQYAFHLQYDLQVLALSIGIGRNLDFVVDMSPKDLLEHFDVMPILFFFHHLNESSLGQCKRPARTLQSNVPSPPCKCRAQIYSNFVLERQYRRCLLFSCCLKVWKWVLWRK